MKARLIAVLLALAGLCAAPRAGAAEPVAIDALMAFARVYGVVRYFHPSDSLERVDWDRFLVHGSARMAQVTDRSEIGPRLEELFAPIVEGFRATPPGAPLSVPRGDGPRVEWRHLGYGVEPATAQWQHPFASWRTFHRPLHGRSSSGGFFQNEGRAAASVWPEPVMRLAIAPGLEAQIPVSLPMSATKVEAPQRERLDALAAQVKGEALATDAVDRAQARADGIALWNIARHFYPYWSVVKVDWDEALRAWLAAQPERQTRAQLREALSRLASPLDDGDARVNDPREQAQRWYLPLSIRPVGMQWVVDASRVPDRVKVGDVVAAIDGKPMDRWYAEHAALESGSDHYKRWRVLESLAALKDAPVRLDLLRGGERRSVTLSHDLPGALAVGRPPSMQELRPGIFYVDVTRFRKADFDKSLPALREARGIVFDLRGDPSPEALSLVPYWITGVDSAQWLSVPMFDKPFGQAAPGWSFGWQKERDAALEKPGKVLLVDARAVGDAESLAAYFPAQKTGAIVGEPSAGANGSIAIATLPSAMKFVFTGMTVTRHDGSPLHGEGIKPDVAAVPTAAGIRAGRDEVLERGIGILARPPIR